MKNTGLFEKNVDGKKVVVCFAGNGARKETDQPMLEFQNSLKDQNDVHQIFIQDQNFWWYQFGIKQYPSIVLLKNFLQEKINNRPVMFIGSCAGAYGALLYGHFCSVDMVMAWHPPARLHSYTWNSEVKQVYEDANNMWQNIINKNYYDFISIDQIIEDYPDYGWKKAIIFSNIKDNAYLKPEIHTNILKKLPNSQVITFNDDNGHKFNSAAECKKLGILKYLIEREILWL